MKIKNYIENLFAQAVALEQNSRSKNIITCSGDRIMIINADSTILIKFQIKENIFSGDYAFYANDYESTQFEEQNGKIIFISGNEEWERKKSCRVPDISFKRLSLLYKKLKTGMGTTNQVVITSSIKEVLDENLSHVEIAFHKGEFELIQRDIFTGTIINIKKKESKGLFQLDGNKITKNISAIGLRTGDLLGLFSFVNKITFNVSEKGFTYFQGDKSNMSGFIAACLYDDLGTINYLTEDNDGGQKPKNRRSQS